MALPNTYTEDISSGKKRTFQIYFKEFSWRNTLTATYRQHGCYTPGSPDFQKLTIVLQIILQKSSYVFPFGWSDIIPGAGSALGKDVVIKEQDRLLPIANVGRIMKQILPSHAKISKEGKETMQECVSEFISFVTGEASDKCHKEKRKTVNGDDICWALGSLGFDDYAEPLKRYLHRFRELEGEKSNQNKASNSEENVEPSNYRGEAEPPKRHLVYPNLFNFNEAERTTTSFSRRF